MNIGLGQTGRTCWLNAGLNLFLMTEDGFKILWAKLQEEYKNMNESNKAYFHSNLNVAPSARPEKINKIYFWKFLDQYMCSIGGPGKLWSTHQRNTVLLSRAKWLNPNAMTGGACVHHEIEVILKTLGFTGDDYSLIAPTGEQIPNSPQGYNKKFLLYKKARLTDLPLKMGNVRLSGAVIHNSSNDLERRHVWTCLTRGSKGYIFDSAYPYKLHACDWWFRENVVDFFNNNSYIRRHYSDFNFKPKTTKFRLIFYSRSSYVDKISPSCRRLNKYTYNKSTKRTYKSTITSNPNAGNINKLQRLNNVAPLPPIVKAMLVRHESRRRPITAEVYKQIVNRARSKNNAFANISKMEMKVHKVNKSSQNYINFLAELSKKFSTRRTANRPRSGSTGLKSASPNRSAKRPRSGSTGRESASPNRSAKRQKSGSSGRKSASPNRTAKSGSAGRRNS